MHYANMRKTNKSKGKVFMSDTRYMEFVEYNDSEGEMFVTFVEITEENKDVLNRYKEVFDRADLEFFSVDFAPKEINEDTVKLMNRYDNNGYMRKFVISTLANYMFNKIDEYEKMDDYSVEMGYYDDFSKRGAFA